MFKEKTTLDVFVKKNFIKYFLYVFLILFLIISVNKFYLILRESIFTPFFYSEIVIIAILNSLTDIPLIASIASFFAVYLNLQTYYKTSEFFIIQNAGIGKINLFKSFFPILLIITLCVSFLTLFLNPIIEIYVDDKKNSISNNIERIDLSPGIFNYFNNEEIVIYIDKKLDGLQYEGVKYEKFFLSDSRHSSKIIIIASSAIKNKKQGAPILSLKDGTKYSFDKNFLLTDLVSFDNLDINLSTYNKEEFDEYEQIVSKTKTIDLIEKSGNLGQSELFWRIILPFSQILLPIISLFITNNNIKGKNIKNQLYVFSSLLIFFLFIITSKMAIEHGNISLIFGISLTILVPFTYFFAYIILSTFRISSLLKKL